MGIKRIGIISITGRTRVLPLSPPTSPQNACSDRAHITAVEKVGIFPDDLSESDGGPSTPAKTEKAQSVGMAPFISNLELMRRFNL